LGEERNCPQEVGYLHQSTCSESEPVSGARTAAASRVGVRWMDADSAVASRINAPWRHGCLPALASKIVRRMTIGSPSHCRLVLCAQGKVYLQAILQSY